MILLGLNCHGYGFDTCLLFCALGCFGSLAFTINRNV